MLSKMLLPTLLLALLPSTTLAYGRHWNKDSIKDYYTLGCPTTTKPHASQQEQLSVLTTFANEVFVQHDVTTGYNTYAAKNFINHAPEITGNGTALAIAIQGPMLAGGKVELQRIFAGKDANGTSWGTIHFKGINPKLGVGVIAGIWRLVGTCLVEYWDVAAGVQNSTNPIAYF
ncbi:hypothetical protein G7Y79_00006g018460 [Physcia stellaris]|nr:hypothetical protein G7Y79_00006g018460 [Physcia stellaris]